MAYILKIGSDPQMLVKEYLTKVFNLLKGGKYGNATLGSGKTHPGSDQLNAFSELFMQNNELGPMSETDPYRFLLSVMLVMTSDKKAFDKRKILQLKTYAYRNKLTPMEAHKYSEENYFGDETYNELAKVMGWPFAFKTNDERQDTLPFGFSAREIGPELADEEPPRLTRADYENMRNQHQIPNVANRSTNYRTVHGQYADWQNARDEARREATRAEYRRTHSE